MSAQDLVGWTQAGEAQEAPHCVGHSAAGVHGSLKRKNGLGRTRSRKNYVQLESASATASAYSLTMFNLYHKRYRNA